jgi:hypothetical protein
MRHRHQPRLCEACRAPMPRQQEACARCDTPWVDPGSRLGPDRSPRHASTASSGVLGWRAHAASRADGPMRRLALASARDAGSEPTRLLTRHTRGAIEAERDRRRQRRAHATRPHSRIAVAVARNARAVTQARVDMDRWVDEGGRVPFEAAPLLRTTASRR